MRSSVFRQIARVVALMSLGVLTPGCLIPAPDELEDPERIPPRVLVGDANPAVTKIVQTSRTNEATEFNVEFESDDQGETVIGRLFLNYPSPRPPLGYAAVPAATIESGPREMKIAWTQSRDVPTGCYTVTLTITHADNYSQEDFKPIDRDKTAFVTWWIAHDIDSLNLVSLDECMPPVITE